MKEYPCELIQDLIPLYKEGILSAVTETVITQHLEGCPDCTEYLEGDGNQPVGRELSETLPQADTFRKWSRHVKRWALYSGLAVALIILAVAAVSYYLGSTGDGEPRLSIRQAVNIFASQGVSLTRTDDPAAAVINGVKPATFSINGTPHRLRIYRFDSIAERIQAYQEWPVDSYSQPFNSAKNLLLLFVPAEELPMSGADLELVNKVFQTIFERLNDTQEIVFQGSAQNWESQTVVKYFLYFYKDSQGVMHHDCWSQELTTLKYLGDDIGSVGEIAYEIESPIGGASGSGDRLKPDGTVNLGGSEGNGALPDMDSELHVTIKWNDRTESFTARSK
ncbi:MAG: zf-HC2 domain-containing protein [Syntrophomonadaceae bacterium]